MDSVLKDPSSIYHVIRTMLQRRRKHLAFGHGDFRWVHSSTPALACFIRSYGIDRMLIVHNLSKTKTSGVINLPESEYGGGESNKGHVIYDILTELSYEMTSQGALAVHLEPYQYLWLNMGEMSQMGDTSSKPVATRRASITPPPTELLKALEKLQQSQLPPHMSAILEEDSGDDGPGSPVNRKKLSRPPSFYIKSPDMLSPESERKKELVDGDKKLSLDNSGDLKKSS